MAVLTLLAVLSAGCGSATSSPSDVGADASDVTSRDAHDAAYVDASCPAKNPEEDDDRDGLPNGVEDANRNCVVDPGETNPLVADTDGDGLVDGDEDIDANGVVSHGETDPRKVDTNGNGVADGAETSALVCLPGLLDSVMARNARSTASVLALPPDFTLESLEEYAGARFQNAAGTVVGFIATYAATSTGALAEHTQWVARVGLPWTAHEAVDVEFMTWALEEEGLAARRAARGVRRYAFGADTFNPATAAQEPAAMRDAWLNAALRADVAASPASLPCAALSAHTLTVLRSDGSAVFVAAFACGQHEASPALASLLEDLVTGTMLAPEGYRPDRSWCEELAASREGAAVDFLWVIDNSGSMADEQGLVADAAQGFVDTLSSAGVDWRVAVTTTESYLLDSAPQGLAHDALLEPCSGLRGRGFLSEADGDAVARFREYVSLDAACDPALHGIVAPVGANVCGSGLESGLSSALTVIQRAAADAVPACAPTHQFQPDARRFVVWVSDEEDHAFKFDDPFIPSAEDDARRIAKTQELADAYLALDITGCAIVGDRGIEAGERCTLLSGEPGAVEGAQYGAGYVDVAGATGGVVGSICTDDLQPVIDQCTSRALGVVSTYRLGHPPVASSLRVAVDDRVVVRSHLRGWEYDVAQNAIVFHGVAIRESSRIAVAYEAWGAAQ